MEDYIIKSIVEDLVPLNTDLMCTHIRLAQIRKRFLSLITSVYEKNKLLNSHTPHVCDSTIPAYTYNEFQSYFKVLRHLNK